MSHSRHSDLVQVDPDNMLRDNQKAEFRNLLNKFDDIVGYCSTTKATIVQSDPMRLK